MSFTITAVVAIVAFGFLSNWQWQRAQEEEAKSQAAAAGAAAEPVPIDRLLSAGEPLPPAEEWRTVIGTGTLQCSDGYLVRNRPYDTSNGLLAVCPLRMPDGAVLWVNRGWLPAPGPATQVVPMPAFPSGEVTVTGRLRFSESGPAQVPADLPAGQVPRLDTGVLASISGVAGPSYEPYLEATRFQPADPAGLRTLPLPPADSAQNFSYAGQWLLFAAIAIGGWVYFLRREAQEEAAAVQPTA